MVRQMRDHPPTVSIIINTDGRAKSLRNTLDSLRYLKYNSFEVVVVYGPTPDGTRDLLSQWTSEVKTFHCPVRNLSQSRNIGIAHSAGEILAFIDDDAIPEPEWLNDLIPAFNDPLVGAAGGPVYNHTGKEYQWEFGTVNRYGTADETWKRAATELNFPNTFNAPSTLGANFLIRRECIVNIGGFDEEFEYFLDETDVLFRLIDQGWHVAQMSHGVVHHKFLESNIRNSHRIMTSWYPLVKNKVYFSLVNGKYHVTVSQIISNVEQFVARFRDDIEWAIREGKLVAEDRSRFEREVEQGMHDGLARGLMGSRRLPDLDRFNTVSDLSPFLPFSTLLREREQRCYLFLTSHYPPEPLSGISRYVHLLATAIARLGHQVHVLTAGNGHDRVDLEDGVWVHRRVIQQFPTPDRGPEAQRPLPPQIWNYSMTLLAEAKDIARRRPIDCVHAPIWDVEGIAFLRDGSFPLITSLHTAIHSYLETNPERRADPDFMENFFEPVSAAERELLRGSDGILANSNAIVECLEEAHAVKLKKELIAVVPRGLDDWTAMPAEVPKSLSSCILRLVYIGRLERRKGIDVLLDILPDLLLRYPNIWIDIVGNDLIPVRGATTWRQLFEEEPAAQRVRDRVAFHGEVSEEQLRGFYRAADIVLAPSRFESFGLVHLEAMMAGKPIIGCRIGGMLEVVDHGRTGLLAEPGDANSLKECIERLIQDAGLRHSLGRAARADYLAWFTSARMVKEEMAFLDEVARACALRHSPVAKVISLDVLENVGLSAPYNRETNNGTKTHRTRICIIGGVVARYDGISEDIIDTWQFLCQNPDWDVSVVTTRNDFKDFPAKIVSGVSELLLAPEFLNADILIYHFGIWNGLFDALLVGNGRARQAVFFHNITPAALVPPNHIATVERSFAQLNNLRCADQLWPVSRTNAEMLIDLGFDPTRIDILPVAVDSPIITRLTEKRAKPIDLLFLGRIVPAKGVLDLVQVIADLRLRDLPPFRLRLAGNVEYSDSVYCDAVNHAILEAELHNIVEFIGTVDEEYRDELLREAHVIVIPSYHEGFCKPVIEGLRAGCVPVGYAAHNLRYIADGLARMVPPGDTSALANALSDIIVDVSFAIIHPGSRLRVDRGMLTASEFTHAVAAHVAQFEPAHIGTLMRRHVTELRSKGHPQQSAQDRMA